MMHRQKNIKSLMRLFGHIVGMGVRDIPKWPGKLEHRILKGGATEWNRLRATAQHCER
jgi:hypothetical protein